ncbi:MAG TPA: NUDIX hydrolase [Nevskiaceae bacterium]|nr:NUDIX hydrolase [Nevskiaceae bacterium]
MEAEIRTLHQGQFLKLQREGRWEYVSRVNARGAGFIVALTPARELLLVEQYRVPLHVRCVELPAGIIGDSVEFSEESVEASAIRELEEETGWRGARARILCSGPTAGGLTSELGHFVQVSELAHVHAGGGVDGEDITVHAVPLAQVAQWLDAQRARGLMVDPRIYVGLYFIGAEKL